MQKRSKVIIDLINNNINVEQALEILDLLLQNVKNNKIKKWLSNEINGYDKNDDLPDYRIVSTNLKGSYIIGSTFNGIKGTNQPLPLKPEYIKDYSNIKIRDGVYKLEQMAIAEKENESHHLSLAMNVLLAQEISCINGEIINAYTDLSLYAYTNIIGAIRSKLLSIFKELEKQYGNLDEYYIDFKDKKKEEKVTKSLITIIYDKSTHIGDNNSIKGSIIGDNNEN